MVSFDNDVYIIGSNYVFHMDFSDEGGLSKNWTLKNDSLPNVEKVFAAVKIPDCPGKCFSR